MNKAELQSELHGVKAELAAARAELAELPELADVDKLRLDLERAMARIGALEWNPEPPARQPAGWTPFDELPDWLALVLDSVVPAAAAAAWSAWSQQRDHRSLSTAVREVRAWLCDEIQARESREQ
jgi:hypothetical protein